MSHVDVSFNYAIGCDLSKFKIKILEMKSTFVARAQYLVLFS